MNRKELKAALAAIEDLESLTYRIDWTVDRPMFLVGALGDSRVEVALDGPPYTASGRDGHEAAGNTPSDAVRELMRVMVDLPTHCVTCGVKGSVIDSGPGRPRFITEAAVRRRRECGTCGDRWTTYEVRPHEVPNATRTHSVAEVAELVGYAEETIRRAIRAGDLKAATTGARSAYRISGAELSRWWNRMGGGGFGRRR